MLPTTIKIEAIRYYHYQHGLLDNRMKVCRINHCTNNSRLDVRFVDDFATFTFLIKKLFVKIWMKTALLRNFQHFLPVSDFEWESTRNKITINITHLSRSRLTTSRRPYFFLFSLYIFRVFHVQRCQPVTSACGGGLNLRSSHGLLEILVFRIFEE